VDQVTAAADESRAASSDLPVHFERELGRQIVATERLCAGIQAAISATLFLTVAIAAAVEHARGRTLRAWQWSLVIAGGAIVYELLARQVFASFLRRDRQPSPFARYVNALVEASIPTLVLAVLANVVGAELTLTSVITFGYYFFIILSALRFDFRLSVFTGLVAAVGYAAVSLWFFDELRAASDAPERMIGYVLRPIFLLMGGIVAGLVARQIHASLLRSIRAAEERRKIVEMFGQHVSPAVVNQLLAPPTGVSSELRDVCILVLDIRNFTTFSETAQPDDVVAYLNRLWSSVVAIINRHHGIVNKFLGDGFMAVFGAPLSTENNCESAVTAAREILAEVERAYTSGEIPQTRVGIGIHAGRALVGNIGSSERREYTVIGDVVNVAFRIEKLNKAFDSALLISDSVRQNLAAKPAEAPTSIPIRGRQEPVQVFKLH
jgi:adenylate cyclase